MTTLSSSANATSRAAPRSSIDLTLLTPFDEPARAGFTNSGKGPSPLRSELVMGFEISDAEINDLVAFLNALTDTEFLTNPKFANPW